MTTRLVGALIMTHSDDDGLVLPPRLAPQHVVILPIYRNDEERGPVLEYCQQAAQRAGGPARMTTSRCAAMVDDRDVPRADKKWQQVKRGVPIIVEIGPRDIAGDTLMPKRRDQPAGEKKPAIAAQRVRRHDRRRAGRDAAEPVRPRAGAARTSTPATITPRRVRSLLHAEERRQAGDPRRLRDLPLHRRAARPTRSSASTKSRSAACRSPTSRASNTPIAGQVHLHRPADDPAGGVRQGVLGRRAQGSFFVVGCVLGRTPIG